MGKKARPLPSLWLFTDERMSNAALLAAIARLPKGHGAKGSGPMGGGIVFRHYRTGRGERRALFDAVRALARRRRLVLLVAGEWPGGPILGVAGRHRPGWMRRPVHEGAAGMLSMPVHDARDVAAVKRAGADMIFASPVFATRSHPGGRTLGAVRFGALVQGAGVPVIALGGMSAQRFRRLKALGADGWAGIDALA